MEDDLVAAYSGLGTADDDQYYRGEECLACVKDLIRSLRDDDPQRCPVRRRLGQAKILQNDLLQLLTKFSNDETLKNDIIRLLVNLTQPAYLCFGNEFPSIVGRHKDPELMKCFIEVNNHLKLYKEAFANQKVMNVLGSTLADHCQKDWECRDEDDMIIIERILLLIRNILHIPTEASEEQRTNDDVSVHDQIIWSLHANGIDELLVFLGSNPEEKQWCMHVMEILFLMLREQAAKPLATAGRGRSATEREKDLRALNDLLLEENAQKKKSRSKLSTRHLRFGGTFMLMDKKGISDNPVIYHRPLPGINSYSHDVEKVRRRRPCNMRPVPNPPLERMSTLSIRLALQQMCVQFLQCCYNPIMKLTKDNLMRDRAMEHDDTYYLWVMRFFMEFSRHYQFRVDIIGETLTLSTLHYVLTLMFRHYENMKMQKRELTAKHSSQRLHYAIQAYKELLEYVQHMGESQDDTLRSNATVIKNNILYRPEYRDIFVTILRNYNEVVSSKALLGDLVETVHIYLRLVEHFCKRKGRVLVQGKRKKRGAGSKRKKSRKETESAPVVLSTDELQEMWDHMRGDVERAIDAEPASCDLLPFDAASETPIEEQKFSAMAKTRELLRDGKYPESIALVRAAREVWPDDVYGTDDMDAVEQRDVLKRIFLDPVSELMSAGIGDAGIDEDDEEDEEQEIADEVPEETYESEFNLKSYLLKFANSHVVKAYCYLLKDYRTNSDIINHCVVKMLHRIAFQLKMSPLLYQLQVFKTFQSFMNEPATNRMKEMQTFAKYIVRGFFEAASNNPIMFVEVLFWKTTADCYEITEGYGSLARERDAKMRASMWTREQEEELAELYQQYQEEDDIVGCIIAALPSHPPRTRQKVAAQLVRQGCISSTRDVRKKKTSKGTHWTTEEDERLQEYMGSHHPNTPVAFGDVDMNALTDLFPGKSPANIERHLKKLGFTYKPRKKGGKRRSDDIISSEDDSEMEDKEDNHSNGNQGHVTAPSVVPPRPKKRRRMPKQTEPTQRRIKPPSGNVVQLVKKLVDEGYSDQLLWLREYLTDEASDRRADDEWEDICIVPVDEDVSMAIESADYQSLLISIGMQPPSDMEQYWRIPADITPAQLDEAVQSLQTDGCHGNSNNTNLEGNEQTRGGQEEDDETLCSVVEEPEQQEDGTPPDEDSIADNNDGAQSDSSEQSGLCIDYHSDSATEETCDRATALAALLAKRKQQQTAVTPGTEGNTVEPSPTVEDSYDKSSPDTQDRQDGSPSPHGTAVEDTRYAATRRRRLLLMDDDDDDGGGNDDEETA